MRWYTIRATSNLLERWTELSREIRQFRPDIPIILMSGYSGTQLSERAQAAGVTDVLRKPLVRRDIAELVARALRVADRRAR